MLRASDIHKSYGELKVLKGVSLELKKGEILSLVGASGAGKSTLLQILGTLDNPDKGQVEFEGRNVSSLPDRPQAAFRNRELGFVFQFHHLLPEFDALENASMPAYVAGMPQKDAREKAGELLEYLGLGDRLDHKPAELSGGEQQRVALARALVNEPAVILADEPTGNLDSANSDKIYELIFRLAEEMKVGFLIATHSEHYASQSDRVVKIKDGLLEKQ